MVHTSMAFMQHEQFLALLHDIAGLDIFAPSSDQQPGGKYMTNYAFDNMESWERFITASQCELPAPCHRWSADGRVRQFTTPSGSESAHSVPSDIASLLPGECSTSQNSPSLEIALARLNRMVSSSQCRPSDQGRHWIFIVKL